MTIPLRSSLEPRGHVDAVALLQGHDRVLGVGKPAANAAEGPKLALADQRIDALHLDVEQLLDRFLDLRLGGVLPHAEDHLAVLRRHRRLFGDDWRENDVVMTGFDRGAHLKRASSASTAARVSTSFSRR